MRSFNQDFPLETPTSTPRSFNSDFPIESTQQPVQPQTEQVPTWLSKAASVAGGINSMVYKALGNTVGKVSGDDVELNQLANKAEDYADVNPGYGTAGKIAGGIATAAPIAAATGPGFVGALATGGITGYLGSDINASIQDKIINTALGTALGGGGYGAFALAGKAIGAGVKGYTAIKNIVKGSKIFGGDKFSIQTPTDIAEEATKRTLKQFGGDFSRATPEAYEKHVLDVLKVATDQKDRLYGVRNMLAEKEGVGVLRTNLQNQIKELTDEAAAGATSATKAALKEAKQALGNNSKLSYQQAQNLVSDLNGKANAAFKAGDNVLGTKMLRLKEALELDIDNGGGSEMVKQAHIAAKDYFKNTYLPIANADAKEMLSGAFSEAKYLANGLKTIDKTSYDAINRVSQEALDIDSAGMLAAAHINAAKSASTGIKGMIDPRAYHRNMEAAFKNNPTIFRPFQEKMSTFVDVLDLAQKAVLAEKGGNITPSFVGMAGMTGAVAGNPATAAVSAGAAYQLAKGVPKMMFFKSAGEALRNPATANLLGQTAKATDPVLKSHLQGILVKRILKQSPALFAPQIGNREE